MNNKVFETEVLIDEQLKELARDAATHGEIAASLLRLYQLGLIYPMLHSDGKLYWYPLPDDEEVKGWAATCHDAWHRFFSGRAV
jgi:hypothetical protein